METDDLFITNFNAIKEMILDEEKLVSYITVSKDFCMHVNNSKRILCSVIKKIREEQPNVHLNVNYIISGMYGGNTATTTICTEKDLDKLRKTLSVIFFDHVYSVCKGSQRVDTAAFLTLNKFEDFGFCIGAIKSNECGKRTSDEIGNLKTNSQETIVLEAKPVSNKKSKHVSFETHRNEQVNEVNSVKVIEIKTEAIKVENIEKKESNNVNKQSNHKANGVKTQRAIGSFFNKSNSVQNKKVSNGITENKIDSTSRKSIQVEEKMNVDKENSENDIKPVHHSHQKVEKEFNSEEVNSLQESISEKKNSKKVQSKVKKSPKVDKKRKRLLHVSDSESDEDKKPLDLLENNHDSDDEIPPTPSISNDIKITSGITNPKKRRKVIDKTYTDENGYMLTKKVEVYESCSENEDDIKIKTEFKPMKEVKTDTSPNNKKSSPKKSKKKISPPQKGKQQTLNIFFQRK